MKYREILLEQLKPLPYFDKETLTQMSKQYGLKSSTIDSYISRSLARKDFFQLKKGLYVTAEFYQTNKNDIAYSFYLANILRSPSYISSWTALQYYNLVTEVVHSVTSVTSKITRAFTTKAGNFEYHSIKKEYFTDFVLVRGKPVARTEGFEFFIATPAKALFDLLYFKTHQFRGIKFEAIDALIRDLRIDIDEMDQTEKDRLSAMIRKYVNHE